MTPYYQDESVTLYHGRWEDVLPTLDTSAVDLVLADPPYGMDNDCDYTRFTMGPNGHGQASSRRYTAIEGDRQPFDPTPWLTFPRVVLWGWNHYASRLPVGTTLVWVKRLEGGYGSFLSDAELAWMNGGHGVYLHRDTTLMADTRRRRHPTEKPVGLMRWCIRKAGGTGTILDPFAGSGPVLRAAKDMGRKAIGIELEERYCEVAARRLQQSAMNLEAS